VSGRRRRYYAAAALLAVVWYALLWGLVLILGDLPGGVHLIGAALVCGSLVAARLSRGFLARARGPVVVVAAGIAVALAWILSLAVYAVLFDLAEDRVFSPAFFPIAVAVGAVASGRLMLDVAYAAVPALVLTFVMTYLSARTLPRSDGQS
jgi:hypothetical protein